jgi:hypothetical protein
MYVEKRQANSLAKRNLGAQQCLDTPLFKNGQAIVLAAATLPVETNAYRGD